jgi:hypothetical protein
MKKKCVIYVYNKSSVQIEYLDCIVDNKEIAKETCDKLNKGRYAKQLDIEYRFQELQCLERN